MFQGKIRCDKCGSKFITVLDQQETTDAEGKSYYLVTYQCQGCCKRSQAQVAKD